MRRTALRWLLLGILSCVAAGASAQIAGTPLRRGNLDLVREGQTTAVVCHAPDLDPESWEYRAAADLVRYIEMMTGARPALAATAEAIAATLAAATPALLVGTVALETDPTLREALAAVAKPDPVLRADAIVLRRTRNRVYLAGTNDESHYYAVAELLRQWGCRWFMPTEFGECIPTHDHLQIGRLDYRYAPPFEVRTYWLSWYGDGQGTPEFQRRNMMNSLRVPAGHALGSYVQDLIPEGGTVYNVPLAEENTIRQVAGRIEEAFAAGRDLSLGMEDGVYESGSPVDAELQAGLLDKYFLTPSLADSFMALYNGVARLLREKYPDSPSRIGFLAYSNMTIPPQREVVAEAPLVAYLAPIDIDPLHGMDDPKSLPRREYKAMMYRWAEVMQGRVIIYDYDQGMLVWRDIPNPSLASIRQDVKHYRDAGILGVDTESRGAFATTFLNLYLRAQLLWHPEADPEALLEDFYSRFYGPAAAPMANYWNAIYAAWEDSIVTEHEFFVAPAIYTPELRALLRRNLRAAEAAVRPLAARAEPTRNERLYLERMRFTRLGYEVLEAYMDMVRAAATEVDYAAAVAAGERGLAAREKLTEMNPIFTTTRLEGGYHWWTGEVQQYRELLPFTDGTEGELIAKLPLEWAFRRDPFDSGLAGGWARRPVDLTWWRRQPREDPVALHMDNPGEWEVLRTDLYAQAQGVLHPDYTNYNGHMWYATEVNLTAEQTEGRTHLRFPGLFNEAWLYVNGILIGHRGQNPLWWYNDYRFEWDVDLTGHLRAGDNTLFLRLHNPHHMGGIWRRPFLYRAL